MSMFWRRPAKKTPQSEYDKFQADCDVLDRLSSNPSYWNKYVAVYNGEVIAVSSYPHDFGRGVFSLLIILF